MDTQRYCFCLKGLQEPPGQINVLNLQRVLNALVETAARATRLLVTGEGSAKGPRPRWLDATVDFTVTDLKASSTALDIDAPSIGDTAYAEFAQLEFWRERPGLRETALDCAALAIREAQTEDPEGNYFDSAVLEAILKFRRAAGVPGVRYELTGRDNEQALFTLDDESCARVRERLHKIPAPRAFVVSGRLDEIKHRSSGFRLVTSNGAQLFGRLDSAALGAESLRPLWGRQATVQGTVHFQGQWPAEDHRGPPDRASSVGRRGLRSTAGRWGSTRPRIDARSGQTCEFRELHEALGNLARRRTRR